ncbi:MAG: aminodeoxychorismate lyase [Pseudomonadota bacterium]|nr:aminodeoxychorismate lyase [Pseudomonadota bacterium]
MKEVFLNTDFASDRGLAFGHGVFETMRFKNFDIPLKNKHFKRLKKGASLLNINLIDHGLDQYLADIMEKLKAKQISSGVLKLIITAGSSDSGYACPRNLEPNFFFKVRSLQEIITHTDIAMDKLGICEHRIPTNPQIASIKHLNRLDQVLASLEMQSSGFFDGIMLDHHDRIIETTSSNIFLKSRKSEWLTPEISDCGISGVMREVLINEIFPKLEVDITECTISMDTLHDSKEIFICNSVRGIVRINEVISDKGIIFECKSMSKDVADLKNMLSKTYSCFY